ncbi:hypothetical protein H1230_13275 [Paenibacillus sp. 19GGS1-52]|uniref:hypothetical protein n=1 Tax=Paenibacillus sp. 19GGS1-52 TaxID=2758563 RepID=UPI001EFBDD39|nr:hypothetical protein [Paenibacillus sp. 19GGS1-52]ULO09652.1 hypothetical protein H1230_13275 [Paenibacillus sp. 19GGS1-52]
MKIENLHVGSTGKNYVHMCEILDEGVVNGKSRQLQLKRWACYFEHEKQGNKWIITKIYDYPRELAKGGNFTPYIGEINKLIVQLLLCSDDKRVILPKNRLLKLLNMINGNYKECEESVGSLSEYLNVPRMDIYDFYNSANNVLAGNIESSLRDLKNKKAVFHQTVMMVVIGRAAHEATNEEMDIIYPIQARVLKEMKFDSMVDVYKSGRIKTYTDRTNRLLKSEAGISYVYEAYNIYLNREVLQEELHRICEDKVKEIEEGLNQSVKDRLIDLSEKRREREISTIDKWFGVPNYKKGYRVNENYIGNQIKLADVLIDSNYRLIVDDIKKINDKNGR